MTMLAFGFGSPADLAIIFIVALIVFGPNKLPEVGKQLGQAMRELRKVTDEITGSVHSVNQEVASIYQPIVIGTPPVVSASSSNTVEQAVSHLPLDQEPEALMKPVVMELPAAENAAHQIETEGKGP